MTHTKPSSADPFRQRAIGWMAFQISRHSGRLIFLTALFALTFLAFLPNTKSKNDVDDFILDSDPAVAFYKNHKKAFPKNEFVVIAYRAEDLFTPRRLQDLKEITDSLLNLDDVKDVTSLANATDLRGTEDAFQAEPFLQTIPSDPKTLETLRARALANPLYRKSLISKDGQTTAIIVYVRAHYAGDGEEATPSSTARKRLMEEMDKVLDPYRKSGYRFSLAGWPSTNYFLSQYMMVDMKTFMPLSVGMTLLTVFFLFRNSRLLLLAGVGILLTLLATLGLAGMTGVPINNASVAVIPLVVSLALSDLVHLFSHLDRSLLKETPDAPGALGRVLENVLFPCLLTSVNTAVGFFSFTFNSIPAIRSFGWLASAGMIFEFIFTFGLVAPLLVYLRPESVYRDPDVHSKREIPRLIRWIHRTVTKRPTWAVSLCLLTLLWGGWQMRKVRVETNLVEFFRSSSPVRQDIDFVRKNLAGTEPIDVSFQAGQRDAFKEPTRLAVIEEIEKEIRALPRIDTVIGINEFFKEMNKAFHAEDPAHYRLPERRRLLEQYLLLYGADDLEDYVTPAYDRTRLVIRAHCPGSQDAENLIGQIQRILDAHPMDGVTARITGLIDLTVKTMRVMVNDQVSNISQTVVVIFLLMALVLRSWGLALLFLLPNLFPIAVNFGIMGASGIPLDTGTSLIAASAFGIIVDDTVHFFVAFKDARRRGMTVRKALEEVSYEKGETSFSSFFIIGIAFSVLMLSHFRPIFFFGALNVLILIIGMAGDQVFLKSILALWARWEERPRRT